MLPDTANPFGNILRRRADNADGDDGLLPPCYAMPIDRNWRQLFLLRLQMAREDARVM